MKLVLKLALTLVMVGLSNAYDLEIQIGKDIIDSRLKVYEESAKKLQKDLSKTDQEFIGKLKDQFNSLGGYNLVDSIDSIKLGWSENQKHEWVAQLRGDFDKKKFYDALEKTSWTKKDGHWFAGELYLFEKKECLIITKTKRIEEVKKQINFKIGVAQVKGVALSGDQSFMKAWAEKSEKGRVYLSMVKGIGIVLDGSKASLSLDFYDPSQAVFATGMISTGLEFLKGMILQIKEKPGDKDNLIDWVNYSSNQMFAAQAMHHVNKLEPKSTGSILSLSYQMKNSVKDLYKSFEGSFVLALGSIVGMLASKQMDLSKLKSMNLGLIPTMGGMPQATGPCPKEMKMIEQAVEFYNSDHVKTGPWSTIKAKVFSEGYLPEDLVCNGKLVKNTTLFVDGKNGTIRPK
ncbi:MAG: hypothetical protein KC646_08810 [Candidatus Cloacimonetes bacterium]|nr:hypothetical protein [Candidatus Cloacimonadota bacterium]